MPENWRPSGVNLRWPLARPQNFLKFPIDIFQKVCYNVDTKGKGIQPMNINFLDPTLHYLLSLLEECGWESMTSDDMEAIADRCDCNFFHGVSRGCFVYKDWDFVIKVPLYADEDISTDYCKVEVEAYQRICKEYPLCVPLFAEIRYLGEYGEMKIYAQEKISQSWLDFQDTHEIEADTICGERLDYSRKNPIFQNSLYEIAGSRLSFDYYFLILKVLGKAVFDSFTKWALDTAQTDLHDSNVGLTADNTPKIFDYAGFDD